MRVFYLFKIKDNFKELYNDTPSILYNILKQIYYLSPNEIEYAKTILEQLTDIIDKEELDKDLFIKHHRDVPYSKRGNTHYMNNLYKDEISKLVINRRYIKIESETNFSAFFEILSKIDNNLFVCDFEYIDFFFLNKIKSLV